MNNNIGNPLIMQQLTSEFDAEVKLMKNTIDSNKERQSRCGTWTERIKEQHNIFPPNYQLHCHFGCSLATKQNRCFRRFMV